LDRPDLAVADFGESDGDQDRGGVIVLLNDSTGGFESPVRVSAGKNPASLVAADFDLDGDMDLAVANFGSNDVSILLNDGGGTLVCLADSFPAGKGPFSLAAADLDDDGDPDLVATNTLEAQVAVLRNDGKDGQVTFAAPETSGVMNVPYRIPYSVTASDLDGDGDQDLAIANGSAGSISVMRNDVVVGAHRVQLNGDDGATGLDFGVTIVWQNAGNPHDVNDDGDMTPVDVLLVINRINRDPADPTLPPRPESPPPFYDVNGDGHCTAEDVLQIVNEINNAIMAGEAEGEARWPDIDVLRTISVDPPRTSSGVAEIWPSPGTSSSKSFAAAAHNGRGSTLRSSSVPCLLRDRSPLDLAFEGVDDLLLELDDLVPVVAEDVLAAAEVCHVQSAS
jgi:hypothetical protein